MIPILSQINLIPLLIPISLRNILILSSHLRLGLPKGLFPASVPTFFQSGYLTCPSQSSSLNYSGYISFSVQTMKFLFVETSPLTICIPLGSKYSPQDPVFKYPFPTFSLNALSLQKIIQYAFSRVLFSWL